MFAIRITAENIEKIERLHHSAHPETPHLNLTVYVESAREWYYVTGYHSPMGRPTDVSWTVLPEYVLLTKYDFDPHKIDTDWDQIVLK